MRHTEEWLLGRVQKDKSGCWLWQGAKTQKGYGNCGSRGKWECVHRVSWRIYNGEIPEGLHVLHRCDVRHCVNPEHLFLGTNEDNVRDMWAKGRGPRTCRLTADSVRAIRASSLSNAELARRYGVTPPSIRKIRIGESWRCAR